MKRILFTSDLHFGHKNIITYCNRPYSSVEEMDEGLILNWNGRVNKNDIIYILGDVFFCQAEKATQIVRQLNGEKRLILGNHDKGLKKDKKLLSYFTVLPDLYHENIDGIHVWMCHYPLLTWDQKGRGSFMLHGHCHNTIPFDSLNRRLDVGVDAQGYSPVDWNEVKTKLLAIQPTHF